MSHVIAQSMFQLLKDISKTACEQESVHNVLFDLILNEKLPCKNSSDGRIVGDHFYPFQLPMFHVHAL